MTIDQESVNALSPAVLRAAGIGALVWLLPFGEFPRVWLNEHSPHIALQVSSTTYIGPIDAVFVLLILLAVPLLGGLRRLRPVGIGLIGVGSLAAVATARLLFEPTVEGAVLVLRLVGIAAVALTISNMSLSAVKRSVIWSFALTALYQGALALAQTLVFGTGYEYNAAWYENGPGWGGWTAGHGTFVGQYTFAAFMVLAIAVSLSIGRFGRVPRTIWLSVMVASASVGVTFGRTGVVSLVVIAGIFVAGALMKRDNATPRYAAAAFAPFLAVAAVVRTPWLTRAADTAAFSGSGRGELIARAMEVIASRPIVGVGPGGYASALADIGLNPVDHQLVHNIPLLVTGEFGIPAGVLFAFWIGVLGVVALRTSVFATALFVAPIPYLLLDNLHWVFVAGIAMIGLWAGMLDFHSRHAQSTRHEAGDPAHTGS